MFIDISSPEKEKEEKEEKKKSATLAPFYMYG